MPYKDPEQRRACNERSYRRHLAKRRIYQKKYREKNKERRYAQIAAWKQTPAGRASARKSSRKRREQINAWRRARRRRFPEQTRAKDNAWKLKNRDRINAQRRANHAANPEPRRAEAKRQRLLHPERLQARFKSWYLRNLDQHLPRQRRYRQEHPEVHRLSGGRRRARKLSLPDTFTHAERQFMLEYWHNACAVCGNQEGFFWTLADDHWIPLASPACPGSVATNMIPLCDGQGGCNTMKQDRDAAEWLHARFPPAKAKRILKAVETYFAIVRARKAEAAAD